MDTATESQFRGQRVRFLAKSRTLSQSTDISADCGHRVSARGPANNCDNKRENISSCNIHQPEKAGAAEQVQDARFDQPGAALSSALGPQLVPETPKTPRTFGNIVRNILFQPDHDLTTANTVPTAFSQKYLVPSQGLAVECTLYELNAASAAILGSQVPEVRSNSLKLVFENDLAVLALKESLAVHGSCPAVVDTVIGLVRHLFGIDEACLVPMTYCHIQLAGTLLSAASAVQRTCGFKAATTAAEAVLASAMLAAAAPAEELLQDLDLVQQCVTAAATTSPAAPGTRSEEASALISAVLRMLTKTGKKQLSQDALSVDAHTADSSQSLSWLMSRWTTYIWEHLPPHQCLQVLARALVHPRPSLRNLAQQLMQQVMVKVKDPAFLVLVGVEQLAAASIAAVESICKPCSTFPSSASCNSGATSVSSDSMGAAALGSLLSLLLQLCTTEDPETNENFMIGVLQLEQQRAHGLVPEQLKIVRALNTALKIIMRADNNTAVSSACALISELLAASRSWRRRVGGSTAWSADAQEQAAAQADDRHQSKLLPKLQEKHFPQLKALPMPLRRSLTFSVRKAAPSHLATLAACLCFCVLPREWDEWEARLATAVVWGPRHGMNSRAVFERGLSTTAGLFSSRRLKKLVKLQNRGVVL